MGRSALELRLNIFPLSVRSVPTESVARVHADATFLEQWRNSTGHRVDFQIYFLENHAWVWALPGRTLPEIPSDANPEMVPVTSAPARLWAFAAREAAVAKLQKYGFERLRREVEGAVRLFRWEKNLLRDLAGLPPRKAGVLPRVSVQHPV